MALALENQNTVSPSRRWLRRVLLFFTLLSLIFGSGLTYEHWNHKEKIYSAEKFRLLTLTRNASKEIGKILQAAKFSAETLAKELTQSKVGKDAMLLKLRKVLADNNNFYGGAIAFAPYRFDPQTRLHSSYYSKSGTSGELVLSKLEDIYDYTAEGSGYDWYTRPIAGGQRWSEPYWDEAGRTYMTTYSAPFFVREPGTNKELPSGVVTIDISMAQIKNIIETLDIGASGFGALATRDGTYLYHPNYDYVRKQLTIRKVGELKSDPDRTLIAEMAENVEAGIINHVSTTTGEASWLIVEPVPISGWSLQNTFIKNDLDIDVDILRHQIIWILVSAIIFLTAMSASFLTVNLDSSIRISVLTCIVSFLLLSGIYIVWNLALNYHTSGDAQELKISDKATLNVLTSRYKKVRRERRSPAPLFIPTGLYIDTAKFISANDVMVTGRLWQKYPSDFPGDLAKGVQFGRAKNVKMEKIGSISNGAGDVIQWSFQADLRQRVNYARYPLEVEQLSVQILPLATDPSVGLVPDLDSYKLTTATLLPGLDKAVFLSGWKLTESFFALRFAERNTDFGIATNFDHTPLPTLYFKVGIKRVFIDAFISNLTPLIIVSIVLFGLVLTTNHVEVGRIMGISVAVFFVVVFSHLDIRKHISGSEIFYLEVFFFVIYIAIILVPGHALWIALGMPSHYLKYHDGLLGKVIYWPAILGAFFIITVWTFY